MYKTTNDWHLAAEAEGFLQSSKVHPWSFLRLHPLQTMKSIARFIAGASKSPSLRRLKSKTNQKVRFYHKFCSGHLHYVKWTRLTYTESFGQLLRQSRSTIASLTKKADPSNPVNFSETLLSSSRLPHILSSQPIHMLRRNCVILYVQYSKKRQVADNGKLLRPSNPISFIGFLATVNLACDTSNIHERAAMCVLSFFDKNAIATTLNIREFCHC